MDKEQIKSDIRDLFNLLSYSVPIDKENKFEIMVSGDGTSFIINGVLGYLVYFAPRDKRMYLKVDPNHRDPIQQTTYELMREVAGENFGWDISVNLT